MKQHEFSSHMTWRQAVAPEDWSSLIRWLHGLQPCLDAICQEVSKEVPAVPVDETEDSRQSAVAAMPLHRTGSSARDPFPQDKLNIEARKNRKVLSSGLCA